MHSRCHVHAAAVLQRHRVGACVQLLLSAVNTDSARRPEAGFYTNETTSLRVSVYLQLSSCNVFFFFFAFCILLLSLFSLLLYYRIIIPILSHIERNVILVFDNNLSVYTHNVLYLQPRGFRRKRIVVVSASPQTAHALVLRLRDERVLYVDREIGIRLVVAKVFGRRVTTER